MLWALAAAYGLALARIAAPVEAPRGLDPLATRPREVERAIADGRFLDALPLAFELAQSNPRDALVWLWQTHIFRGLERPSDEAAAWDRYIEVTGTLFDACPWAARAHEAAGNLERARDLRSRCADDDRRDLSRASSPGPRSSFSVLVPPSPVPGAMSVASGLPFLVPRFSSPISR
jgi:hypothetical protein